MTKAVRAEKAQQAVDMSARSVPVNRIAEELEVSWPTARKLIDDELAERAEHREQDKERHLAVYDRIQRAAWERFEQTDNRSLNASGYLNTVLSAESAKVKLTGAEAPQKRDVNINDQRQLSATEREANELDAEIAELEREIAAGSAEEGESQG